MKILGGACLILVSLTLIAAIPEDVEVLEGFNFEDQPAFPVRTQPDTDQLLTKFLLKAIRNRRSPRYEVLESEGLRSHFKVHHYEDEGQEVEEPPRRARRHAEEPNPKTEDMVTEELPNPEKLTQNGYYEDEWSKYAKKDDMDTQAEASAINEGIKARAPRVNFITQNQNRDGKSLDVSESRDARSPPILPDSTTASPDYYRKNLARIYLDYPRPYDSYPRPYEYERNFVDRMSPVYPEYYDARRAPYDDFDSYMPRTLSYPNYYYYPDKRYDLPEPRDPYVANTYHNEVPPLSPANRNRRIIYYTTLPEVVRTPPNVNLNFKGRSPYDLSYDRADRSYYPYNYYNYLQTPYPPLSPSATFTYPPAEAYRANRSPRDFARPGISSITPLSSKDSRYSSGGSAGGTQKNVH